MTTMMLKEAADSNQQGANMIAVGNYEAAFRLLAQAAGQLRDMVTGEEQGEGSESWSNLLVSMGCKLPVLSRSDFHIFNRDFQFYVLPGQDMPPLTREQQRFCIAIVMFNMGLGRHGQAKKTGRAIHLTKALSLYSMGLEMLRDIYLPSECTNLLTIGALNNMAEICYELGDIQRAKRLLKAAAPLLRSLSESTVSKDQVEECYLNSLVLGFAHTARCA